MGREPGSAGRLRSTERSSTRSVSIVSSSDTIDIAASLSASRVGDLIGEGRWRVGGGE